MKKTLLLILTVILSLDLSAQLQGGSVSTGKDKAVSTPFFAASAAFSCSHFSKFFTLFHAIS